MAKITIDPSEYVTVQEAAKLLDVSKQRVSALCRSGKVRTFEFLGYHFPHRADIEHYKSEPTRQLRRPFSRAKKK